MMLQEDIGGKFIMLQEGKQRGKNLEECNSDIGQNKVDIFFC